MRQFTIVPTKAGRALDEVVALDEAAVLYTVSTLNCDEAAVFEGDVYRFSLRLDSSGPWSVFQREVPLPSRPAISKQRGFSTEVLAGASRRHNQVEARTTEMSSHGVLASSASIVTDPRSELPPDYRPSADEEFMNPLQLEYFRQRLLAWKKGILSDAENTLNVLQMEELREPDLNDRASNETGWSLELRTRDRERKLIAKINAALRRIDEGDYGYCEITGEPIALGRLEARPIATMTVEAQEQHERQERISRDG